MSVHAGPHSLVVVGGGIAGMAAAYRAHLRLPEARIALVEGDNRLGGKILTERIDGFVFEGGPDSFLSSKRGAIELCRQLEIEDRLQGTRPELRRSFVVRDGRLHLMPEGLSGLIPSRLGPMARSDLVSAAGKVRMALDFVLPAGHVAEDESLASFVSRRLGADVYSRLVEPLMAGIYAGDGTELSLAATFPQLRALEVEYGSLIRGIQSSRSTQPTTRPGFLTPRGGMGHIVDSLAGALRTISIYLNTSAQSILPRDGEYVVTLRNGAELRTRAVIIATPAFAAGDMVERLDRDLADSLRSIPYVSSVTLTLAFPLRDVPRPLAGYGYIVPRRENRAVLACTWVSSKFRHRAPEGNAVIRVFFGRAGTEDFSTMDDESLLALARDELREMLGISAKPILSRIYRWPRAMPQYTLGHLDRIARIEGRLESHPGLFVAGHAYRGVGIPDCIQSGETAAEKVVFHIGAPATLTH